mmetsp:Transcript_8125/g.18701  ORF Transcript_8125/g.18701 Transcript_8125/m.18701 type:complete len:383 (-) Transcript_8125:215-1363(-)
MPIYEEKLISPFAVRFTQEHIRPVFQDGQDLEATVAMIATRPGIGEYDFILEVPFPSIEIIRWHQRGEENRDSKRWCTVDNRRLYCLQRAAADLWPRRAAIAVEVLYAAPEDVWKKDDSSTAGLSVGIGHSLKALVDRWDWRAAVVARSSGSAAVTAQRVVARDEEKASFRELLDAPAPPSMLDLFFQGEAKGPGVAVPDTRSEGSTREPLTPRSSGGSESSSPSPGPAYCSALPPSRPLPKAKLPKAAKDSKLSALAVSLCGRWNDDQGVAFDVWAAQGDASWHCARRDTGAQGCSKEFDLWYDAENDSVWWGDAWSHYLDASEVRRQPGLVHWFGGDDFYRHGAGQRPRPHFTWRKASAQAGTQRARRGPMHSGRRHGAA